MKKIIIFIFVTCYLIVALLSFLFKRDENYEFQIVTNLTKIADNIKLNDIELLGYNQYNHASSITSLGNKLFVTWYSGAKETSPDTKIILATFKKVNHRWKLSNIRPLLDRKKYQTIFQKRVHHLGNPSILSRGKRLWLFFTTSSGGWATSSLNIMFSDDEGKTWSTPKIILSSPVLNYGTLARGAGIKLNNENFALPVYKELNNLTSRWLIFDKNAQLIDSSEMTFNGITLQPSIVPISKNHAIAFYRAMRSANKKIYTNESFNAGKTWTKGHFTKLNNPDASVAAIRTKDGILLAYNNSIKDRLNLSLAYKKDNSNKWKNVYTFENIKKYQLSYPFLIIDQDNILLSFSYGPAGKTKIKIVEIKTGK